MFNFYDTRNKTRLRKLKKLSIENSTEIEKLKKLGKAILASANRIANRGTSISPYQGIRGISFLEKEFKNT